MVKKTRALELVTGDCATADAKGGCGCCALNKMHATMVEKGGTPHEAHAVATCEAEEGHRPALPPLENLNETNARIALGITPAVGDVRIVVEGDGLRYVARESAYEAVATLGSVDAYTAAMVADTEGRWRATDRFGLAKWVNEGVLPEMTPGWRPPQADARLMDDEDDLAMAEDVAWEALRKLAGERGEESQEVNEAALMYECLRSMRAACKAAMYYIYAEPSPGDMMLIVDGETLLTRGAGRLLAPLFAIDATLSFEVCMGDDRWTALEPWMALNIVDELGERFGK